MSSVNRAELTDLFGYVDIVMANGVVHHLDDEDAERLFALASSLLKSGGRLVTIDPVLHANQGHVRRWLVLSQPRIYGVHLSLPDAMCPRRPLHPKFRRASRGVAQPVIRPSRPFLRWLNATK
jgi:Methyltransferase domain